MEIVIGVVVAGAAVYGISRLAKHHSEPTRAPDSSSTSARASRPARQGLLVTFARGAGVKVDASTAPEAAAELAGRATGAAVRGANNRRRRAWAAITAASKRSRQRREKGREQNGRQPLSFRRDRTPSITTARRGGWRRLFSRAKAPKAQASEPSKPAPAPSTPGPEPPHKGRHLAAVPDPTPPPGGTVTATIDTTPTPTSVAAPDSPPDWALMADRIRNFAPEDDSALLAFMRGESIGVLAYAEAMEQARDNCVNDVGLDPAAVGGFTAYSEHVSEAAARMSEAYKTFVAVYGEVLQLAASGVVMPYRGRFFTGSEAG